MKVVLVDCLIYQGLLCYQRRRAAGSPDRDEPITARMKRAQCNLRPLCSLSYLTSHLRKDREVPLSFQGDTP
jgi:hypothetical protein